MRTCDFRKTAQKWVGSPPGFWAFADISLSDTSSQSPQETSVAMKSALFLVASLALVLADGQQNAVVTLADGPSPTKGRVEVTIGDGEPMQVCSTDFDSDDTDALCEAAGFPDSAASVTSYGVRGGLQFVGVECTDGACQFSPESLNYRCPGTALGLDCSPRLRVTGSIGLEAGIIAGILVTLIAVIAVVLGLSACLYRNDLIPCLQNAATD